LVVVWDYYWVGCCIGVVGICIGAAVVIYCMSFSVVIKQSSKGLVQSSQKAVELSRSVALVQGDAPIICPSSPSVPIHNLTNLNQNSYGMVE